MSILKLTGANHQPVYIMREAIAFFKPVTVMVVGQPVAKMTAVHLIGGGDVDVRETPDDIHSMIYAIDS